MLKHLFIFLAFALFITSLAKAQTTWVSEDYSRYSTDNFRDAEIFKKVVRFDDLDYRILNACLFYVSNEFRVNIAKEKPLEYSEALEIASWHHAKAMGELGFFSHTNAADPKRKEPTNRAKMAGIKNPTVAENIHVTSFPKYGQDYLTIAEGILADILRKDDRKLTLASGKAREMGCGVFVEGSSWYVTQMFQWFKKSKVAGGVDKLPSSLD